MKAVVHGKKAGSMEIKDVSIPEPKRDEVLIQIKATGFCHTDVTVLNNEYDPSGRPPVPVPVILGHEGAGIISKLGSNVKLLNVGDRVGFEPLSGCGICNNCKKGNKNMCMNWQHLGITCDGTFAEYVVVPAKNVHKLPDKVSFADAAFLEPIGLTVRSLEHVKPMVGDVAAVVGPGSIGLFHVQALKAAGVKVIVLGLDQDKSRFKIAEKLGADHIVSLSQVEASEAVNNITNGQGADIVIETASSPKALDTVYDIVGIRGRVSTFGLYPKAAISPVNILRKGVTIYGDVALLTRHFMRAIRWIEEEKVLAEPLITQRYNLEEVYKGLEALDRGETVKVLFKL